MADRRCPNCGELVPSNSITCPKCFRKIPKEPEPVRRERETRRPESGTSKSRTITLILSTIPAVVGLLGLGIIYNSPRSKLGYIALVLGFPVYIAALLATISLLLIFVAVPLWILYALMFLACLFLSLVGNVTVRVV